MRQAMKIPGGGGAALEAPRIENGAPMLIAGLAERHPFSDPQDIPGQWRRFMALYDDIDDKAGPVPVGVSANMDEEGNFEYFCAVEVTKTNGLPARLKTLRIPAQTYAVFLHRNHVSKIAATYAAIWNQWLPENDRRVADGPSLERHLETFDPRTGMGGVEIWIPIQDA